MNTVEGKGEACKYGHIHHDVCPCRAEYESRIRELEGQLEESRNLTSAVIGCDKTCWKLTSLAKVREQFEETKNQLHLANIDAVKNEAEANELREQNQAMREVLGKIADQDYRGNRCQCMTMAHEALKRGEQKA